jgi:hypothetical protein
MNTFKISLIALIMLGVVSCAGFQTSADRSDYKIGYNTAWKFAKDDAINSNCFTFPRIVEYQTRKSYANSFRDQGRSEAFLHGFNSGYKYEFYNYYNLYCD